MFVMNVSLMLALGRSQALGKWDSASQTYCTVHVYAIKLHVEVKWKSASETTVCECAREYIHVSMSHVDITNSYWEVLLV